MYTDMMGLLRWPQDIYDDAVNDAQSSGLPGPHNGPQDAYRHCLASCESTRENSGIVTQCMAWANEKKGDWKRGQEEGERAMDDHNNALGINFGKTAKSYGDCQIMCKNAVRTGSTTNSYTPGSTPPLFIRLSLLNFMRTKMLS